MLFPAARAIIDLRLKFTRYRRLLLFAAVAASHAYAANDDSAKKLSVQASQLARKTHYYVEQARLKAQETSDENTLQRSSFYDHMLEKLLSLPKQQRAEAIQKMVWDLREAIARKTGEGAYRTQVLQNDSDPMQMAAFAEFLDHLHRNLPYSAEIHSKIQAKANKKMKTRATALMAVTFASVPIAVFLSPIPLLVAYPALMADLVLSGKKTNILSAQDKSYTEKHALLMQITAALANDATLMEELAAQVSSEEKEEASTAAQRLFQSITRCNLLLAPAKTPSNH